MKRRRPPKFWRFETKDLRRMNSMVSAWAKFLESREWDLFGTFTFRRANERSDKRSRPPYEYMTVKAAKPLFRKFVRSLSSDIWFIAFFETGSNEDNLHIHALLGNTTGLSSRIVARRWWWRGGGSSKVFHYDKERGANHYLPKTWHKVSTDFDSNLADFPEMEAGKRP